MLRTFTTLAVVAAFSLGASSSLQAAGWQVQLHGLLPARFVKAFDVTTTAAGDVIAVGRVTTTERFDYDFTVVCLHGSDGSEQWRRTIGADSYDSARAVTVDSEGAVIAAGTLGGLALVKLDGATGADVWTTVVDPDRFGWVNSIALDASGDVAVVGGFIGDVSRSDFAVVKFAGDTGAELWRQVLDGGETGPHADRRDEAKSVLVDSAGDVVASGWLRETDSGVTFTVIKFDGTTGSEIWRAQPSPSGRARAIAADANGDVFAVGLMNPGSGKADFAVVKLDGSNGEELWRRELTGEALSFNDGLAVAVDSTGDVVAAGTFNNNDSRNDFSVVKLAGGTGAELWRSELRSAWIQGDAANALAIDADDNVVAVGRVSRRRRAPAHGFTVVKLDGSSGSRMWLRELDAVSQGLSVFDEAFAVAVDAAGDVAAAGVLDEELSGPNFTVVKLGGADGLTAGACQQQPRTDCVTTARKSVL
ncbi:MAG: PQQ-binding-like beta-propeller repeat protein, partial [Candidatus Binatia bacterium]